MLLFLLLLLLIFCGLLFFWLLFCELLFLIGLLVIFKLLFFFFLWEVLFCVVVICFFLLIGFLSFWIGGRIEYDCGSWCWCGVKFNFELLYFLLIVVFEVSFCVDIFDMLWLIWGFLYCFGNGFFGMWIIVCGLIDVLWFGKVIVLVCVWFCC